MISATAPKTTILLTEITDSDICWLEPRDLDTATMSFQPNDPNTRGPSAVSWRQPYVVFGDSINGYTLEATLPVESLNALTTIAGGEPVTRDQLIRDKLLK